MSEHRYVYASVYDAWEEGDRNLVAVVRARAGSSSSRVAGYVEQKVHQAPLYMDGMLGQAEAETIIEITGVPFVDTKGIEDEDRFKPMQGWRDEHGNPI